MESESTPQLLLSIYTMYISILYNINTFLFVGVFQVLDYLIPELSAHLLMVLLDITNSRDVAISWVDSVYASVY